jgi:membrane protease YdiL (CAAX protease family)
LDSVVKRCKAHEKEENVDEHRVQLEGGADLARVGAGGPQLLQCLVRTSEKAAHKPSEIQSAERRNVMTSERAINASDHAAAADQTSEESLSLSLVVLLHLLPGALLMGVALLLAPMLIERGVPYELVHIASGLLTIVPFMFGAMLLYGRLRYGRTSLREVVRFREPMPIWQYAALYVPMLALALGLSFAIAPLSSFLAERVFFWLPPYLLPSWEAPVTPSHGLILFALLVNLLFDGFVFPVVEELYFRGFLLPRMAYLGVFAPAVNALLFTLWHLWQPYNWPLIFLAVLVNAYVAWWNRNIYIAMLLHCSANTIGGVLALIAFFAR